MPKDARGRVDKEAVKQLFLKSDHLSWRPFCEEKGYDYKQTTNYLPTRDWIAEKITSLNIKHKENVNKAILDVRTDYEISVIKTLKTLPPVVDGMISIITAKINSIIADIQSGGKTSVDKLKNSDLFALQSALESAVRTKHKSLMLDGYTVELVRTDLDTGAREATNEPRDVTPQNDFTFELIGGKQLTQDQLKQLFHKYVDPAVPETEEEKAEVEEDFNIEEDFLNDV